MKKNIIAVMLSGFIFLSAGCSNKPSDTKSEVLQIKSGVVSDEIKIGSKMKKFMLKDQFGKEHELKDETKKIIFVFQKGTGHSVKEFLNKQPVDYLEKREILFVADVSPMPSLIREYMAMPDLRKHKYPILLFLDEEVAKKYKNEKEADKIMVVKLENRKVVGVTFLSTQTDLKNEIEGVKTDS